MKIVIVIGIVVLFIGASVVSGINNTVVKTKDVDNIGNLISDPWWDLDWRYRKQITINHAMVDGTLLNFPLLIKDTSSDFGAHAQADGDDFVFTTEDGTKLNHEIEKYDGSPGELITWVNIPSLSSVDDTLIYVYYGNSGCSSQENIYGTWDSNFWMVQHLNEDGTVIRQDSTSNSNDGFPGNYDGDEATDSGKIDGGDYLDGGDDYMTFEGYPITSTYTVSCWIKLEDITDFQLLFEIYSDYFMGNGHEQILNFRAHIDEYNNFLSFSEHAGKNKSTNVAVDNEWHHFVGAKTGSSALDIYIDGTYEHTHTGDFDTPEYMVIGCDDYHDVEYTKGTFDEVRTSKIARSSAWISTEYNNQNNPELYITFGEQEEASLAPFAPDINGPPSGTAGENYSYTFVSIDWNDDDVFYQIDWGDGTFEDWFGPYQSNELISRGHTWSKKNNYTIRARAKDVNEEIGDWAYFEVSMPMNQQLHNWWFLQFLQNHPRMFPILKNIFSYIWKTQEKFC